MASYLKTRFYYPVWLWGMFITISSLIPGKTMPRMPMWDWIAPDKIVHLAVYAIWAILLFKGLSNRMLVTRKIIVFGLGFLIFYGVLIEILQSAMYLGRSFEISDIVANCVGVFIGFGTYSYFIKQF